VTRQITSKVREERKKGKFSKNTANTLISSCRALLQDATRGLSRALLPASVPPAEQRNLTAVVSAALRTAQYRGAELPGADLHTLLQSNLESGLWFGLALSFTFKVQLVIMQSVSLTFETGVPFTSLYWLEENDCNWNLSAGNEALRTSRVAACP